MPVFSTACSNSASCNRSDFHRRDATSDAANHFDSTWWRTLHQPDRIRNMHQFEVISAYFDTSFSKLHIKEISRKHCDSPCGFETGGNWAFSSGFLWSSGMGKLRKRWSAGGILSDTAPVANTLYETTQNKSFYTPENATDLMQFCHQVASSLLPSSICMKSVKIKLDATRSS